MTGSEWSSYFRAWLPCAGVRALKTVAQTAAATLASTALITEADWRVVVSASLMAGVLSLLTSLGGLPEVDEPKAGDE